MTTTIVADLQTVRERIARAAQAAGRRTDDVGLIAVSKTFPAMHIAAAYDAGQRAFGESYAQEAVAKVTQLSHLNIIWHFVGPVQSNKTRDIAGHFQWVHSLARARIAQRLNDARPAHLPPLNVCIQVNVSGENSKSGVAPGAEIELARAVLALPRLCLRGLMAIPEPATDMQLQRRRFALLRQISERLTAAGIPLDTLSMGMSDDLEAAIAEGATLVRVGTAIFGQRPKV